MSRKGVSIRV